MSIKSQFANDSLLRADMPKENTYFRVAREGKTVDGREITGEMLTSAAETYDPAIYGARIWCEHIRSASADSSFGAYGDVLALKVDTDETGRIVLLAAFDPTPELVALNKKRQKVYSSIEIGPHPDASDKWLLSGIAVTDSPASTGTQMLKFSLRSSESTPTEAQVSEFMPTELNFAAEQAPAKKSWLEGFAAIFTPAPPAKPEKPEGEQNFGADIEDLRGAMMLLGNEFKSAVDAAKAEESAELTELKEQYTALDQKFTDLKSELSKTQDPNHQQRPPADGRGDGEHDLSNFGAL